MTYKLSIRLNTIELQIYSNPLPHTSAKKEKIKKKSAKYPGNFCGKLKSSFVGLLWYGNPEVQILGSLKIKLQIYRFF